MACDDLKLITQRFEASALPERARWASGLSVRFPENLTGITDWNAAETRSIAAEASHILRRKAAFTTALPLSSRLPVSYQFVPGILRRIIAKVMGHRLRNQQDEWARFPGWPIDLSADLAADLAGEPGHTFQRAPVLLTHDIDTPEGLANLVKLFLPLEESCGARSANYVVPCGWTIDHGLLAAVAAQEHEIGIHGYDHANRTPFASPDERQKRLAEGRALGNLYGATGYRAPSLLRTEALLHDLAAHYRYDSSIPTSGGPFPVPNNGCVSARPWRLGGLWEIPLTMPRDGSLRFLGYTPEDIGALWLEIAGLIARSGGIVSLLTHCEKGFSGNPAMLRVYRSFLEKIAADGRFAFMTPNALIDRLER